ncbi:DUF4189 domain-containing protein [Stenotrophomonas sp. NPDC077659]|uniref:DUF4189 domain-containing protein n=1 Tax=Stenotrophomonas sp. NPDC077659 TaxID=3390694 RepID=UPI003CFCD206
MTAILRVAIAFTFVLSAVASAQQPGSAEYNSVFLPAHGVGDTRSPDPRIRWGAIAVGDDKAWGYTLVGKTEEEARSLAVADCQARGSKNCVPLETFFNSCIAVAVGPNNRSGQMSPKGLKWVRRQSLKECGPDCKIVYEGCAVP